MPGKYYQEAMMLRVVGVSCLSAILLWVGSPRGSPRLGLDPHLLPATELGWGAKLRHTTHDLTDFCHQSGQGPVLVYDKLLTISWQRDWAMHPWGRLKTCPSFVILAGIRSVEIHFLREENTLFVWALPFSSTKPQFLLSLSTGFTCFHLSVGNFLHMNNNGITDMVIFLGRSRYKVSSQKETSQQSLEQQPISPMSWKATVNVSWVAFIHRPACQLPISDDSVRCSFWKNGRNKSSAVF